jgi:hypothetical protein
MIKSKVKFVNLIAITLVLIVFPNQAIAQNNILDTSTWTVGNGSVSGFNRMGTDAENIRENGVDPYGNTSVLWKSAPDVNNNSDGGWQTPFLSIDETKTYRLTVWIKKTNSDGGQTRFGFQSRDASNAFANLRTNGTALNAPYFFNGDLPTLDKWYLLVGYVHSSSYTGNEILSGVYDPVTGNKVLDASTDYKFAPGAITLRHRAWLRGTTNTEDFQFMSEPTLYEVNGQEPSVENLISPDTGNPGESVWTNNGADISYSAGNVAIGRTSVPSGYALAVDGNIRTREVRVDQDNWPDYVFEENYNLPTLQEVENHIKEKGHLLNIPSAKEVETNGLELGEMNRLLLEKIEELTLYMLRQQAEINTLKKEIKNKK